MTETNQMMYDMYKRLMPTEEYMKKHPELGEELRQRYTEKMRQIEIEDRLEREREEFFKPVRIPLLVLAILLILAILGFAAWWLINHGLEIVVWIAAPYFLVKALIMGANVN